MNAVHIRPAKERDLADLYRMCRALWPGFDDSDRQALLNTLRGSPPGGLPNLFFVAALDSGELVGFAEASVRSHADGCDPTYAVAYLEGWFVDEAHRAHGIGANLVKAVEGWARVMGCREFASDTWIDNVTSQHAHEALGFEVVDRCIHYRKTL